MRQIKIAPTITDRRGEALERYLQEIGKEAMIMPDEEAKLARKIHNGDEEALQKLVCANLRFVVSVAKQYQGQGLGLIDLINEGNMGLITAARKFDETRGFKFISYAVWWIRQSILQSLAEQSRIVRLPQNQVGNIAKVMRFYNHFIQENERKPSPEEISTGLQMDLDKVTTALQSMGRHVSIDAPLVEDEDSCLIDLLHNDDSEDMADNNLITSSLKDEVRSALSALPDRDRNILKMFFGLEGPEMSLDEIGVKLNLSRERVRQIKEKSIRVLRTAHEAHILKSYLG